MPLFGRYPARPFRPEQQHGSLVCSAGEYAIGTGAVVAQALLVDLLCGALQHAGFADAVEGKGAHALTQVAPGFQVPVVAVVEQALGREFAFTEPLLAALEVSDGKTPALGQGVGNGLEIFPGRSRGSPQNADTPADLIAAAVLCFQQLPDVGLKGCQLALQQTWLHRFQQLLHAEQRMQLGGVEPDPGEFIHFAVLAVAGIVVAVACAVIFDRGVEVVAHIVDDALCSGAGTLQHLLDSLSGDRIAVTAEKLVQGEYTVEAVH